MDLSQFYFVNNAFADFVRGEGADLLQKYVVVKQYEKGQSVFSDGAYPKGVFLIDKGKIKIFQKREEGFEQVLNIHIPGEIVGYRPLLCEEKYPVGATAIEDCQLAFIPKKQFLAALNQSSALSNMLLKFLSYEFTVWVNTISNLKDRSVKERLHLNLLILIQKYRGKKKWPVEITLSRADLAGLVGTSHETLARLLKVLREEKCFAVKGRKIIFQNAAQEEALKKFLHHF
jgi:CRP-like cAMP-binding protein